MSTTQTAASPAKGRQASGSGSSSVTQIYEFPNDTPVENIHVCDNGKLLLTSTGTNTVFSLDPSAPSPSPNVLATLNGTTGLTGIVAIAPDTYAVSGGAHSSYSFANNSMSVSVIFAPGACNVGTVLYSIPVPNTQMLNGMVALPGTPHVVLSSDSIGARIFRIDTLTRTVDVAFADPLLGPGAIVTLGANGLKIRDGYLYFANSGQGFFARVAIDGQGNKVGDIETLASLEDVGFSNAYDDFAFDGSGNAYVALHSFSVVKITPEGEQTVFAGGGNSTFFKEPTSVALAGDGKAIFVTTGGATVDGTVYGGQVIKVDL
ncbi:hypothetical protein LHYA1_G003043 [Lachnellula hyalina]|uniref:SMP-30/Gluconolactonase/LRE-like region domain-containing protein n=1 Tax=Lachnellula hyalina TaxID=1316788 RepID=A0A8H8R533_9HELO|nr:uncharacterized protein LHYA1_G003043 [Lachnellula hyalina]TVY27875.1 hypothetical protein LHYA1_G003043 [Lachnellula hyalina]